MVYRASAVCSSAVDMICRNVIFPYVMKRISPKQLRESRGHSQVGVAAAMGISQPAVSKLERRADISIVALGDYIAALGGELEVTARFADGSVSLAVGLERTGFVMPEDWMAEVARIRAMPPDARMEEVANFSEFYAAASRRG